MNIEGLLSGILIELFAIVIGLLFVGVQLLLLRKEIEDKNNDKN